MRSIRRRGRIRLCCIPWVLMSVNRGRGRRRGRGAGEGADRERVKRRMQRRRDGICRGDWAKISLRRTIWTLRGSRFHHATRSEGRSLDLLQAASVVMLGASISDVLQSSSRKTKLFISSYSGFGLGTRFKEIPSSRYEAYDTISENRLLHCTYGQFRCSVETRFV